jgi:hypothetical protein
MEYSKKIEDNSIRRIVKLLFSTFSLIRKPCKFDTCGQFAMVVFKYILIGEGNDFLKYIH